MLSWIYSTSSMRVFDHHSCELSRIELPKTPNTRSEQPLACSLCSVTGGVIIQGAQDQPGIDKFFALGHESLTVETAGHMLHN